MQTIKKHGVGKTYMSVVRYARIERKAILKLYKTKEFQLKGG